MIQLLSDSTFNKGFNIKGRSALADGGSFCRTVSLGLLNPDWMLCQWNCSNSFEQGEVRRDGERVVIEDESKRFGFLPHGSKLSFQLLASREYKAPESPTRADRTC